MGSRRPAHAGRAPTRCPAGRPEYKRALAEQRRRARLCFAVLVAPQSPHFVPDARSLAAALADPAGGNYPESNIVPMLGRGATAAGLELALEELGARPELRHPAGSALVYLACELEPDGRLGFADAEAVPAVKLGAMLASFAALNLVVVLDLVWAGGAAGLGLRASDVYRAVSGGRDGFFLVSVRPTGTVGCLAHAAATAAAGIPFAAPAGSTVRGHDPEAARFTAKRDREEGRVSVGNFLLHLQHHALEQGDGADVHCEKAGTSARDFAVAYR